MNNSTRLKEHSPHMLFFYFYGFADDEIGTGASLLFEILDNYLDEMHTHLDGLDQFYS